ncbi:hypothetical protein CVT26_002632 [Gymnopilus dilepis]|uniref:Uncharacterized protein n=1 Tax=Gymnopilus dilepis TaxID=231916 RepID=A0A409VER0_9AGAR|nr:hypothetical protein CVT26_002632 [Gymnopilus dilepis]
MAPSSSAPFSSSSKSPRSPSDRTSARPGASSWSTSYSRTSSTRTERSFDDEEEEGYEEDLTYRNKQAVAGPSSSPYDPRLARPIASPLAPGPGAGEMARWQAPPPNNAMAPYPYDNRIQSAPIVGQNQALYQNTYAPAPHISNRDTGNTNTSQVTDAYNDKSRHRVEVTNMTIHNHYHAPQSAPPTYPSSPPISASASGPSAPSAYPSAPKESRRRSRSRGREVEYFPLQNDIPIYESAPAMQREASASTSVPYPNFRHPSEQKAPPATDPTGRTRPSGHDQWRGDLLPPQKTSGRTSSGVVRPEGNNVQHSRAQSVDRLNSEMAALSVEKARGRQRKDNDPGLNENRYNVPVLTASGGDQYSSEIKGE